MGVLPFKFEGKDNRKSLGFSGPETINILDIILIREGRDKLAKDMFDFLPKLSLLDLEGWDVNSLLSHK